MDSVSGQSPDECRPDQGATSREGPQSRKPCLAWQVASHGISRRIKQHQAWRKFRLQKRQYPMNTTNPGLCRAWTTDKQYRLRPADPSLLFGIVSFDSPCPGAVALLCTLPPSARSCHCVASVSHESQHGGPDGNGHGDAMRVLFQAFQGAGKAGRALKCDTIRKSEAETSQST